MSVTISHVLRDFYIASGMKLNTQKSTIYGIGADGEEISQITTQSGCNIGSFPFMYLGLPIVGNMRKKGNSKVMVNKIKTRLSKWKENRLSMGGRVTLFKAELGSISIYYMSIFKVPEGILTSLESLRSNFFWRR